LTSDEPGLLHRLLTGQLEEADIHRAEAATGADQAVTGSRSQRDLDDDVWNDDDDVLGQIDVNDIRQMISAYSDCITVSYNSQGRVLWSV
jgi:hypothetical protein